VRTKRIKRTKPAPFPGRTSSGSRVETNSCRCLREPTSASVPTHSFKFRGQSADLPRGSTEAVGPQFPKKKCGKSEISEISPLLTRSTVFHLVSPVINGTIILPTRPGIGERPVYPRASVSSGLGPVSGGCGVLQVVKTAQSRGRTERTLFYAVSSALRRRALAGRWNAAERRNPLLSHYHLLHRSHHAGKR
jgi:hypothetical protein